MTETIHDISLAGCTPEPLMSYLKALGILRLVSEQKDPEARGWWLNDVFWIRSTLDKTALANFFLDEYRPTPIVAPWNAGSGFYTKWDEKKNAFREREASAVLSGIESSTAARFQPYRDQIAAIKNALKGRAKQVNPADQIARMRDQGNREHWSKKKTTSEIKKLLDGQMFFSSSGSTFAIEKADKDKLVCDTRSSLLRDAAISWIDAAFVMRTGRKKNRIEAPLLGSGGNMGNSDFSARFMQIIASCLPISEHDGPSPDSAALLDGGLSGHPTVGLAALAVDQFDPGRAGGANMHQGMEARFRMNPWDYILMLEGAVVLQSASSKRLEAASSGSAFPFAVESTPGGFASCGNDTTRGEQWLPLWHRPCTASEIKLLMAEGRTDMGPKRARTGVEFARAAASLGIDRGIDQFVRVQYQARFGDNYLANSLGRVQTSPRDGVGLLRQIDPWLDRFRRAAGDKNAPPRFGLVLRHIDSAVFDFCRYGEKPLFQRILITLGQAERELSTAERFRAEKRIKPIMGLSPDWLDAANDQSPEFSLALALALIRDCEKKIGPLRANLEPVDWQKRCRAWSEQNRSVVWNSADLATNLANCLQRRIMDGQRQGCEHLPQASRFAASLFAVAGFIEDELDEQRIEDLIWGLMLVDGYGANLPMRSATGAIKIPLPRDYALLKLLFLPRPLAVEQKGDRIIWRLARKGESGIMIRPEPRILPLLRAERVGEACRIAAQRLRNSGLQPMPGPLPTGMIRDADWVELSSYSHRAKRLAGALLIPIGSENVNQLVQLVCRSQSGEADFTIIPSEGEAQ